MPELPPIQWSNGMENLHHEHIVLKVMKDARTINEENVRLGYPFELIRDEVINKGRADFTIGHEHDEFGELTADEKVLLYCFMNMKVHFFEALSTFRAYRISLKPLLDAVDQFRMVDLGCGPGTAGLALAESFKQPNVRYIGLDCSDPMLRKARTLLQAAIERSLLHNDSVVKTTTSWVRLSKFPTGYDTPTNVLINTTYLFASESLNVDDVCNVVTAYKDSTSVKRLLFIYSNTEAEISGVKFNEFKKKMKGQFESTGPVRQTVRYRKKRSSDQIASAKFVRQLMDFKAKE